MINLIKNVMPNLNPITNGYKIAKKSIKLSVIAFVALSALGQQAMARKATLILGSVGIIAGGIRFTAVAIGFIAIMAGLYKKPV